MYSIRHPNADVLTSYLESIFDHNKFRELATNTLLVSEKVIKDHNIDSIAFTGASGSAMAYLLSYHLRLPLLHVRKEKEKSHYPTFMNGSFEGWLGAKRYLIVDDIIATGTTVRRIMDVIKGEIYGADCVAMILYDKFLMEEREVFKYDDRLIPVYYTRLEK